MIRRTVFLTSLVALALAGCVDRGDWKPAPQLAPHGLSADRALAGAALDAQAWPAEGWWRAYGDPQLDALVQQALAGSPSLEIAQARLRAAQGQALAAHSARLPQVSVNASVERQRFPENGLYPPPYGGNYYTQGQATLNLSYDLDFWGHYRQLAAAARAGVEAAQADQAAARLALSVAVVKAYIQHDLSYALLDVTNDNLRQQQQILELTQQRVAAGLENTARVKQSEGQLALVRAGVAFVQANIDLGRDQLADLVAAGPDRGMDLKRPALTAPHSLALPSLLPADLLGRRPDIVASRAQVESAAHGIKAAEANFYPDVNLTAFVGFSSLGSLGQLFDASDRIIGGGPALSLPVFNRGALTGALYVQQAQYDQSVGQYNQTLLDAVRQVADVVANWRALERESAEQQTALEDAQRSYDLTTERYKAGLDNYLSVLSSQNQVLLTQGLRAELAAQRLTFSVDLVLALGGGYLPPTPAS
jgi:NodT family efflux transporter outer membrane factor (OMF) lipoprotein